MSTGYAGYTIEVAGVRDRLRAISWRTWFRTVVITGVVAGVINGVDHRSITDGVFFGVSTGLGIGVYSLMAGRNRRRVILPELSDADRATVVRTVRQGSPVSDARLAPAVIEYAKTLREADSGWADPRTEWLTFGFFALLGGYFAVAGHRDGNDAAAVMWGLFVSLIAAATVVGPRRRERRLQRLDHVERSARALVETPW